MSAYSIVPLGSVLPVFFDSFAGATGASITITGLAVTDIEIFKGVSMTQRASDAGYVLLDTDGIDLDGITGIQGFSIDTGDNTDAGFFVAGSFYNVVVSAITVDSQTVNFVAARFRLVAAENTAGVPVVDTVRVSNTVQTARDIGASVLLSSGTGTGQLKLASGYVAMTWADIAAPTTTVNFSGSTIKAVTDAVALPASATIAITGNITGNLSGSVGSVVGAVGSVTGAVGSVTGNVGGNVTGSVGSVVGLTASDVGAIKTKTDSLNFTTAGQVDANVQYVNDVEVLGDGAGTPWGP